MQADIVEIDAAVVRAAAAMGFDAAVEALPGSNGPARVRVHVASAEAFVSSLSRDKSYDLVVLDAFDGSDAVPAALLGRPFLTEVSQLLRPRTGALLLNMHGELPQLSLGEAFMLAIRGQDAYAEQAPRGKGYDPASPAGRRIVAAASALAGAFGGDACAVRVARQGNVVLSVVPGASRQQQMEAFRDQMRSAAQRMGAELRVPFECGERAVKGLHVIAAAHVVAETRQQAAAQ